MYLTSFTAFTSFIAADAKPALRPPARMRSCCHVCCRWHGFLRAWLHACVICWGSDEALNRHGVRVTRSGRVSGDGLQGGCSRTGSQRGPLVQRSTELECALVEDHGHPVRDIYAPQYRFEQGELVSLTGIWLSLLARSLWRPWSACVSSESIRRLCVFHGLSFLAMHENSDKLLSVSMSACGL